MPKPVKGDNGSGMTTNPFGKEAPYLWVKIQGLSKTALHYIGGILKHIKVYKRILECYYE